MNSISQLFQEIKASLNSPISSFGTPLLTLLIGIVAFGLGHLSAFEMQTHALKIRQSVSRGKTTPIPLGGYVVASEKGSVYYLPWCSGAQKIAPEAQVWFRSEEEAQKAGFKASKACAGISS